MAVVKAKPTSAGRRFVVKVVDSELHKGAPHKALISPQKKSGGRNNAGRITTRHRGGGHKQHYRTIDWKRSKDGIPAVIERLEYDPNRTANIALLKYADGERRYIIAPKGVHAGDPIMSGPSSPIKPGNALAIRNIPVGSVIHCVELKPGKGAQMVRSAGAAAQVMAHDAGMCTVYMVSQEARDEVLQATGFGEVDVFVVQPFDPVNPAPNSTQIQQIVRILMSRIVHRLHVV